MNSKQIAILEESLLNFITGTIDKIATEKTASDEVIRILPETVKVLIELEKLSR